MAAATGASLHSACFTGLGRAAPSPPPSRRRPRRRPPPPRAVCWVPAARLGRSAPPLSSACSCSRRRAPAAAAARADGDPGAPTTAAALLYALARSGSGCGARRRLHLRLRVCPAPRRSVSPRPRRSPLPAPGPSPALTCALRSRRGRDVGRRPNASPDPLGLERPRAPGRTQGAGVLAEAKAGGDAENRSPLSPPT